MERYSTRYQTDSFSPDYNIAFQGSIELAVSCGVDEVDILKNEEEIDNYFT